MEFRYNNKDKGKVILFRQLFIGMSLLVGSLSVQARFRLEPVYMFGYAFSVVDSVSYVTEIQKVETAWVHSKYGFLKYRPQYAEQLKNFIDSTTLHRDVICAIYFDKKKSTVQKLRQQVEGRKTRLDQALRKQELPSGFHFRSEVWDDEPLERKSRKKK